MTASKKIQPLTEAFTSYLRDRRMRMTSERMAVIEAVALQTDVFTVEGIYAEIARGSIRMSLATVYNTVGLLCDARLVSAMSTPDSPAVIYKVAGNSAVQIFRICENCGNIRETTDRGIASALSGHKFRGFVPRTMTMTVYGLCTRCSRLAKKKP